MPTAYSSTRSSSRFLPVLRIAGDRAVQGPVALSKDVCLVGRNWGVHLPLGSKLVSKIHALIVKQKDGVYVRDLASRNHVLVNGQAVREMELGAGDVMKVGPFELTCAAGFAPRGLAGEGDGPRAPAASLEIDGGVGELPLDARAVLIGRRPECDLVIGEEEGDDGVSPVHAVIFELDGERYVRDLNSSGGTRVNGDRVHQRALRTGDEVTIGRTRMRYVIEGITPGGAQDEGDEAIPLELDEEDRAEEVENGRSTPPAEFDLLDHHFERTFGQTLREEQPALANEGGDEAEPVTPAADDSSAPIVIEGEAEESDLAGSAWEALSAKREEGAEASNEPIVPLRSAAEDQGDVARLPAIADESLSAEAGEASAASAEAIAGDDEGNDELHEDLPILAAHEGDEEGVADAWRAGLENSETGADDAGAVRPTAPARVRDADAPPPGRDRAPREDDPETAPSLAEVAREIAAASSPGDEESRQSDPDAHGEPPPGDRARAVEKLDEIVSALAHDVKALESTWKDVKEDGAPPRRTGMD